MYQQSAIVMCKSGSFPDNCFALKVIYKALIIYFPCWPRSRTNLGGGTLVSMLYSMGIYILILLLLSKYCF